MARQLSPIEGRVFEEVVREAEPSSIEVSSEIFLRRLKEKQEAPLALNHLPLWLNEDPLRQP